MVEWVHGPRARGRGAAVLSGLGGQAWALVGPVAAAVRGRQWQRLWLGPGLAVAVAVLALAFRTRPGHAFLVAYAITEPGDPLGTVLLKLPLSMFAPAALLPFWFAVLQVGVVYSVAQALVGTARTVLVAVTGHLVATRVDAGCVRVGRRVAAGCGDLALRGGVHHAGLGAADHVRDAGAGHRYAEQVGGRPAGVDRRQAG